MGEPADGKAAESMVVGEAYAAARELLQRAEEDAARIRADADRYVRQRHQEAELVVAKARRMLAIAEERAAAIGAGMLPRPLLAPTTTVDLTDGPTVVQEPPPAAEDRSALDSVLAGAVSRAIERALPSDR